MAHNTVCHIEFPVTDMDRGRRFYEGLFGWNFREFGPSMVVFGTDEGHVGGLSKADKVEPSPFTHIWIQVSDVDPYLAKAPGLGERVVREKYDIPHVGHGGEISDPDGNPIGLVQFAEDRS